MSHKRHGNSRTLYVCEECGAKQMLHWTETTRSTRARCLACGSTRLEIQSKTAKDDQIAVQAQRYALGETGRSDLHPAARPDSRHRKIV